LYFFVSWNLSRNKIKILFCYKKMFCYKNIFFSLFYLNLFKILHATQNFMCLIRKNLRDTYYNTLKRKKWWLFIEQYFIKSHFSINHWLIFVIFTLSWLYSIWAAHRYLLCYLIYVYIFREEVVSFLRNILMNYLHATRVIDWSTNSYASIVSSDSQVW